MGNLHNIKINLNDIEVDVEDVNTTAVDTAFTVDFEEMSKKREQVAKDDIELGIESLPPTPKKIVATGGEKADLKPAAKKEPSLTISVSYKDIQVPVFVVMFVLLAHQDGQRCFECPCLSVNGLLHDVKSNSFEHLFFRKRKKR